LTTRWVRPSDHEIAGAMKQASARLLQLYPGATLARSPMQQADFDIGDHRHPIFFVGLIAVTKTDGCQISYSVRWNTEISKGTLKIER